MTSEKPVFPPRRVLNKHELFKACSYDPTPPQRIIHDAGPHDAGGARFRIVSAGVRTGKTHCAAWEIVAAALAPSPYSTEWWCVAPLHSLADRCFRMVCAAFTTHFPEHVIRLAEHDGELRVRGFSGNEARILRRSTERGLVSLTGASVDGMVLDEASAIDDDVWASALSTRLLDRLGWVLAISSPRGTSGWWARALRIGLRGEDSDYFGITMPTWSNPRVSRREILKIKARMEEWRFRQEYGGELIASAGKVFDHNAIEACATGRFRGAVPGENYVAGLDLAIANDSSVLTVARRGDEGLCDVVHVDRWTRLPWDVQVERVRRTLGRFHDAPCRVDETGLGNPVLQQLRDAGVAADGVVLTPGKKNEIVRNLAVVLERGRIVLPMREAWPEGHDELLAYEYLDRDGGDLRKMGAPGGGHDDCVMSLALVSSYFRGGSLSGRSHVVNRSQPLTGSRIEPDDEREVEVEDDDQPDLQIMTSGEATPIPEDYRRRPVVDLSNRQGLVKFRRFGR